MGIADVGWATFDVGAQLRASESMLIRSICNPYTKNINGLFYIKGRDAGRGVIDLKTDIKTLEGKIYADTAWSSIRLQLPAFAELADVDVNTINQQTMDTSALLPALIAGTIDAFGCTAENGPYYTEEVAKYDLTGEYILFVDYGLVMLSYTLWTTDKMIVKDPDLLAKVVEGLQKGFKFTCENLDDAVDIFISANPEWKGKNDAVKAEWLSGASAAMDKAATDAHGIGWHDDGMVKQSVEAVYVIYDISEEWQLPSYKDIYTNDFIDTSILPETWPW